MPNLIPAELVEASRALKKAADAIAVTADKWAQVADAIMAWDNLAAFAIGVVAGAFLIHLFRKI